MKHAKLSAWVAEMAALCGPDRVEWLDGSEAEKARLEARALASGELVRLDSRRHPGCLFHRTAENDVARTEHLTYICSRRKEDAGPTNNWMSPEEGYRRAGEIFRGSMRGRTMYVIPFSMGPVGSPFSKIGVQLTDSLYVALNMRIMTRAGAVVLDRLGPDGEFTRCLHGKADLSTERRLILHFPDDNAIWSVGSGYGGNALLGKKCLSLRIASALARREGWLAEHMLILGVEDARGRTEYLTAAFPSACGKTNLAMLIPPAGLKAKGYKVWTVGDDIAWLRVGPDGRLWAVNPEAGFFGVAPGTNSKSNPNAVATLRANAIFTNVLLGEDKTVWWEGGDGEPPQPAVDWRGRPWRPGLKDEQGKLLPGAHPNSRFTVPAGQCPSISPRWEDPQGVPISAIVFGGRRERLAPLVYEAFDWAHGVYTGATAASERTAAQVGKVGEVRRDPMAMLPFCGYNMADYFAHWLEMGRRIPKPPKIFHVNWFRKDARGRFLWPGYGDNLRVLEWILARCRGEAAARQTPIGRLPAPESLDLSGLELGPGALEELLAVRPEEWREELAGHKDFFARFGDRLPKEIWDQHEALAKRVSVGAPS
ncbi:MAG: phosphoenolpyruvate carboxykinase (GTP) [Elusimicrobia bacterium]|nr:phosphoenolpyruvate carboxykinase (GTP) [Elusimicrobiota bacterium]